ncbi:MAG TPA: NCS1 family transporter [Bacillales bacterium]|nr:NCS1 family transporter [Bacillales bacterium]
MPSLDLEKTQVQVDVGRDQSLEPKTEEDRTVNPIHYFFMWTGDGVNMGNMTLGASIVVAGVATLNIFQTLAAALITVGIISLIFVLNDRPGYKLGIPYVVQLKVSFGEKGTVISSLLRGLPAVIWYGVQTWIGGTALNEIMKVATGGAFDSIPICFVALMLVQIVLSMYGFTSVKWVETLATVIVMLSLIYIFIILLNDYSGVIAENMVHVDGSWGLPFLGIIMVLLGNYAAIFLSASDYSRELKTGMSGKKRGLLYFSPIVLSYGFVIVVGAMLAAATGITNPAKAFPVVLDNSFITIFTSVFIVVSAVATNMVANIIPPIYVAQLLTKSKLKYKAAAILTGLLALISFPWLLVQESSAEGLALFVLIYSAFLGPIVSILLIEYFILRKKKVTVAEMYKEDGQFAGYNPCAILAMCIGAGFAFLSVDLTWVIGFVVAGISYIILMKYAFNNSNFKKGTIFE